MANFQGDKTQKSAAASRSGDAALCVNQALRKKPIKIGVKFPPAQPPPCPPAGAAGRGGPPRRHRRRYGAGRGRGAEGSPPPRSRPRRGPPAGSGATPRTPYLRQRGRAGRGGCRRRPAQSRRGGSGPGGQRRDPAPLPQEATATAAASSSSPSSSSAAAGLAARGAAAARPGASRPGPGDTPRGGRRCIVTQPPPTLPPRRSATLGAALQQPAKRSRAGSRPASTGRLYRAPLPRPLLAGSAGAAAPPQVPGPRPAAARSGHRRAEPRRGGSSSAAALAPASLARGQRRCCCGCIPPSGPFPARRSPSLRIAALAAARRQRSHRVEPRGARLSVPLPGLPSLDRCSGLPPPPGLLLPALPAAYHSPLLGAEPHRGSGVEARQTALPFFRNRDWNR